MHLKNGKNIKLTFKMLLFILLRFLKIKIKIVLQSLKRNEKSQKLEEELRVQKEANNKQKKEASDLLDLLPAEPEPNCGKPVRIINLSSQFF